MKNFSLRDAKGWTFDWSAPAVVAALSDVVGTSEISMSRPTTSKSVSTGGNVPAGGNEGTNESC